MATGFMAGSIISKMLLDTTKWSNSIKVVKGDEGKLKGMAAKTSEGFRKTGAAMTIAGAAIVTGLALAVNKAADAQETYAKFATVFDDVGARAEGMAADLQKSFGLSEVAAKDMLGATGDLLTGLGMGADVALDLSAKTQQLSVDLASFTNFSGGASGASEALTKAMLGERESIKALGIVITEEMVKEQLLADGKSHLTGLAEKQAKAEATLKIAVSQSKNAIGDYERTSGSLVNQKRLLAARAEDLVNTLGTHLIPVVTTLITKVTGVVTKVSDWMKANPKLAGTIVKIAAGVGILLSVLGPIVMMIPPLVAGITLIGTAITATTGVIGILIVALGALVVGILKVADANKKAAEATALYNETAGKFEDKLKGIATKAGLTAKEFETLKKKYDGNTLALGRAIKKGKEGVKLQDAMNEVGKVRVAQQKEQKEALEKEKKALDVTLPSLKDFAAEMGNTATAIEDVNKKTETYLDFLEDMGLKTLKEKGDRVKELEGFVKDLDTAYKNGKLSMHDYKLAVESARREIEDMSTEVIETAIPAANDLWGALKQAPAALVDVAKFPGKIEIPAKLGAAKVKTAWENAADGLKTKWAGMWGDFLDGPISLKSFGTAFTGFLGNMKSQFADMVGSMLAKWTTGFLSKLVTGTGSAVADVGKSISGIAGTAKKLATDFSPGGMVASAVGTAVGTFLGSIIGPKGPSANDTRLIKEHTWEAKQHLKNIAINEDAIKWSLWNFEPILNDIKLTLWDQTGILGKIEKKLGAVPVGAPAASAAKPGVTIERVTQNVNINGIMISDRDWARRYLIPEIFHALEQRALKKQLQSILGMS